MDSEIVRFKEQDDEIIPSERSKSENVESLPIKTKQGIERPYLK